MSSFELIKKDTAHAARLGKYTTPHGAFDTPNFMPVGTRGTVKGVDCERLTEAGAQITLVNTYHLWLRPTPEVVRSLGDIHAFTGWKGPILSDSGGFQVFSLAKMRKISEKGVEFRSHLDGQKLLLTPEKSIEIQETLGVDIAMAFDECPSMDLSKEEVATSLALTLRWAQRSLDARKAPDQTHLFGITQGGKHRDLRTESAEKMRVMPFSGFAIGGLSVGEPKEVMYEILSYHPEQLPQDHIRYLMGVGTPRDIVEGVKNGVDLFDCVMPTRAGRFGRAFISGRTPFINVKNQQFALTKEPLDSQCSCVCCRNYSLGYVNHLLKSNEMLGASLVSIHNLTHYLTLMRHMREAIANGTFDALYQIESARWQGFDNLQQVE
jgi:queuine tRNA-ribosyltransferase